MSSRKISQNSHRSATQLTAFTASLALDVLSLFSRLAMEGHSLMRWYWSISLAFCVDTHAHSDDTYRGKGRLRPAGRVEARAYNWSKALTCVVGEKVQGHTKNAPHDGKALPRHPDQYVSLPFEILNGDLMIGLFGELHYE